MSHEMDLLSFLHKAVELRTNALTERANREPDFAQANHAVRELMESVTDEKTRAVLLQYEELKNDYIALLLPYIYRTGARDSLELYGLLSKQISSQW